MRENRRSLRRGDVPASRRVFHRERELGTICSRGGASARRRHDPVRQRRDDPSIEEIMAAATGPVFYQLYEAAGRSCLCYGLLAAGEAGVRHMLGLFRQQIDEALAFLGVRVIDELDPVLPGATAELGLGKGELSLT
jgi:hypothetical protein